MIQLKKIAKPKMPQRFTQYAMQKPKYKSPGIPNIAGYRGYSAGKIEAANRRLQVLQAGRAKLAALRQMQALQRQNEIYARKQLSMPQRQQSYSTGPASNSSSPQAQAYDPYDPRNYTPEETQGGFYVPTEKMPNRGQEDKTQIMAREPIKSPHRDPFFIPTDGVNRSTMLGKRGRGI